MLLFSIVVGGGVVAVTLIVLRRVVPQRTYDRTGWIVFAPRGPIPYGLAIAIGAIACSIFQGFNPH